MRGEKPVCAPSSLTPMGSPPRARGKVNQVTQPPLRKGITPACAGKSTRRGPRVRPRRDHPRVRGEKCSGALLSWTLSGSPPRARGKVNTAAEAVELFRITPACAGKSHRPGSDGPRQWDHPRVRGEKGAGTPTQEVGAGSPPRARGKVLLDTPKGQKKRITPACAGKSAPEHHAKRRHTDHPRVRGEKRIRTARPRVGWGSPPRARGKACACSGGPALDGITPACAGKRLRNAFIAPSFTDALSKCI